MTWFWFFPKKWYDWPPRHFTLHLVQVFLHGGLPGFLFGALHCLLGCDRIMYCPHLHILKHGSRLVYQTYFLSAYCEVECMSPSGLVTASSLLSSQWVFQASKPIPVRILLLPYLNEGFLSSMWVCSAHWACSIVLLPCSPPRCKTFVVDRNILFGSVSISSTNITPLSPENLIFLTKQWRDFSTVRPCSSIHRYFPYDEHWRRMPCI